MAYLPNTQTIRNGMLSAIGADSVDELFADIPSELKVGRLNLPDALTELEAERFIEGIAAKNKVYKTVAMGNGAYRHYIPPIVKEIASRAAFVTAYTPYQAEASQGLLQIIFEFQSMICNLTGMEAANASVYDGATAAAEAINMCKSGKRVNALVSSAAKSHVIETVATYSRAGNSTATMIPTVGGLTDIDSIASLATPNHASVYVESPNRFGLFEDVESIAAACKKAGLKLIVGVNPIALGAFRTPAEQGADIAVGEGQPLGLPLSYGGPYLGFMAAGKDMSRKLPGRIVGETVDKAGNRAYVLTLQAREQHIRREKASSSICSNEALCALTATVYLSVMGANGLRNAALTSYANAHLAARLFNEAGFARRHDGEFFNEFLTECPCEYGEVAALLGEHDILCGANVDGGILWAFTEMNTIDEIETIATLLNDCITRESVTRGSADARKAASV